MGYYTHHKLEIEPLGDAFIPQCEHENPDNAAFCMTCGKQIKTLSVLDFIWEYIARAPEAENIRYGVGEDGNSADSRKWYDHREDMYVLSKKFPGALFILSGDGEENDDMWIEYWHDGSMQLARAKIVFDDFDPEQLMPFERKV